MSKALKFIGTFPVRESSSANNTELVGGPDPTLQLYFLLMLLLAHEVWWDGALLCYCSQDWFNAFIRSISTTHCITIIAMITSVSPK